VPPSFGTVDGKLHYTDPGAAAGGYFYVVRSCNAAGACSDTRVDWPLFADGFESGDTSAWASTEPK
jgi:hypothetical protein